MKPPITLEDLHLRLSRLENPLLAQVGDRVRFTGEDEESVTGLLVDTNSYLCPQTNIFDRFYHVFEEETKEITKVYEGSIEKAEILNTKE